MNIISLNLGQGMYPEPLIEFLTQHKDTTDVFCFQEMSNGKNKKENTIHDLLSICRDLFSDFACGIHDEKLYRSGCLATFVHTKHICTFNEGGILAYGNDDIEDIRVSPYQIITINNQYCITNLHGLYRPGHKLDTIDRITQSNSLCTILDPYTSYHQLIVGDFNLHPKTESIQILEKKYINLNTKFDIQDTRGPGNKFFGTPEYQPYADYAFSSPGFPVSLYTVEEKVISDHKALLLSITV